MGFLDYFRNRPERQVQGDLFAQSSDSQIVFDRKDPPQIAAYRRLHDLIKERGGRSGTHRVINAIAIREMLGEEPDGLYDALGISRGDVAARPLTGTQPFAH